MDRSRHGIFFLSAMLLCAANLTVSLEASAKPSAERGPGAGKAAARLKKTQTNSPPSLSGDPAVMVLENSFYDFLPDASDPDGDTLSFTITNKPRWADFDPTTGALYGTPVPADVGRYGSIQIAVSDGRSTVEMPAFSIEVTSTAIASVTLSWQPPTQNSDGTPLTDLAGYRIYYGVDPTRLSNVVELPNPGMTSYLVENLTPDTWYFAATAVNSEAQESEFSAYVVRDTR